MAHHGAELLRKPGLVQHRAALALDVGRHGQQGADRQHAGAADAGHQNIPRLVEFRQRRLRQFDEGGVGGADGGADGAGFFPSDVRAVNRNETGAETLHTGEVAVAGALIYLPLAPQRGLLGQHRQTVGLHAAVPATLAHLLVDEDAAVGGVHQSLLSAPAFFGGAGLVVDDGGGAGGLPHFNLNVVESGAVVDAEAFEAGEDIRVGF